MECKGKPKEVRDHCVLYAEALRKRIKKAQKQGMPLISRIYTSKELELVTPDSVMTQVVGAGCGYILSFVSHWDGSPGLCFILPDLQAVRNQQIREIIPSALYHELCFIKWNYFVVVKRSRTVISPIWNFNIQYNSINPKFQTRFDWIKKIRGAIMSSLCKLNNISGYIPSGFKTITLGMNLARYTEISNAYWN